MKLSIRDMILISLFAALMAVGAYLKIPNPLFPTVPLTFQLFFCVFAGLLLGSYKGAISQLIYVALGLIGIPVFAGGGGFDYVLRPTFGFILGFVVCAALVGYIIEKKKDIKLLRTFTASLIGLIAAYVVGITYMYLILKFYSGSDVAFVGLTMSMIPYMIKDLLLVAIAAMSSVRIIPAIRKAGYAK